MKSVKSKRTTKSLWRSIDSAPKDGSVIIVYCRKTDVGTQQACFLVCWSALTSLWHAAPTHAFPDLGKFGTYWMPVPKFPSTRKAVLEKDNG